MDLVEVVFDPTTWLVVASLLLYYFYRRATQNFDVFEKQGIPGPKPMPVMGNLWGIWKEVVPKYDVRMIEKYGKTFGSFDGTTPVLYTIEPDLIKSVFVKDFDHFVNRRDFQLKTKVFRKFVSFIHDQEWKDVRSSISPSFTTGKIKRMSALIRDCTERLSRKIQEAATGNQGKVEVKKLFGSFTLDVIARCAFGMNIGNLGDADDPFLKNASVIFTSPISKTPVVAIPYVFRKLGATLANAFFSSKEMKFFVDTVEDLIRTRRNDPQKYNDFVEILSESLKESVRIDPVGQTAPMWSQEEADEIVIAQCVLFLLTGFDTTGTTLTNACFLLAKHPEVQERLYKDICHQLEQKGGDIDHDLVNFIPYLDQVINETLRLYPTAPRLERECSRDITYGNITIKKGMIIAVPARALQRSQDYYRDPERFDPDRWSPENKNQINPYAFLPFGAGPRNCVGMRFALEEVKFALCAVVHKFRFYTVDQTPEEVELSEGIYGVNQVENFQIGVELR